MRELNPGQKDQKGTHISDWRTFATSGHSIGRTGGKLTVVVFSDYECPFCRLLNSKIDSIQVARPDARIVFRDFPLAGHLGRCLFRKSNGCISSFKTQSLPARSHT